MPPPAPRCCSVRKAGTISMRIYIKTFGCRLNQAEADTFAAQFVEKGWQVVARARDADVALIHSCTITRTAEQAGFSFCRRLMRLTPAPRVVLSGCIPEAASREALAEAGLTLVVPRAERDTLVPQVIAACAPVTTPKALVAAANMRTPQRTRPLLKVQDGCDFFCAYCIVPYTRGRPISRPVEACLADARVMVDNGAHEIVIAGCNTARYDDAGRRLPELLRALAAIPGLERLRISSIEPATLEREIADIMADTPVLCRQLHLPLQSGDDTVLRAMGRRYTTADFRAAAEYALARVPDLGLGSDIITGFPGETDEQFENTRNFVASLPFSNLHVFPYSKRPGTPAATRKGQVPVAVCKARAHTLITLGQVQRQRFARSFLGKPTTCLIEGCDAAGVGTGWSSAHLPCRIRGLAPASRNICIAFRPATVEGDVLVGAV